MSVRPARVTSFAKARAAAEACVSDGKVRSDSITSACEASSNTQVQRWRPVDRISKCMAGLV